MQYISTKGDSEPISAARAIIRGLAPDCGLYVPQALPPLPCQPKELTGIPYKTVAEKILGAFFADFSKEELAVCADGAYDAKFDVPAIAPLAKTDKAYFLELWHGSTAAFKDMALSILPRLLAAAVRKEGEGKKIAILTATSGDTGKAALAGFADVPGTEIIVFYPKGGVSAIQERQMLTQAGGNTHVIGIRGNFDDAQAGVKAVFGDTAFAADLAAQNVRLSSANSINIGRLVPQVAYYVYAYARLLACGEIADGERINICVPTGNFGNILSAWYAKQMGLPVARLICASNENKVLTDFIATGVYDARREFILTSSPSMDILVSSNLERLLWHLSGGDGARIAALMNALGSEGVYDAGAAIKESLHEFHGGFADTAKAHSALAALWQEEKYLIDTHTAVAYSVYLDYLSQTGDRAKTVIASTASPYKFAGSVAGALGIAPGENEFRTIENLSAATGMPIPKGLRGLDAKPIRHTAVCGKADIKTAVSSVLLDHNV
ncbi:MAG: threonine synthase [Clostridiales Family XIII bacterium]|jgi:threonine synthase|nr:threonine synthase [Clostridiales Family XIII bacterium]